MRVHNTDIATQYGTEMQHQAQQILDKCKEVVLKARELYGFDLSVVQIKFDLKGRAAGQARRINNRYFVRFNRDMLTREAFNHVLNNTVPHEFAHIICFMDPRLGRDHDGGWARVCQSLGGTPNRCHSEEFVYGKGITYEYVTSLGFKVRCSQQIHAKIQRGISYKYRSKGTVSSLSAHSIVGMSGRTLAAPIVKQQAPNSPDQIEMARRQAMVEALREQERRAKLAREMRAIDAVLQPPKSPAAATFNPGESKASVARAIMLSGYRAGKTADQIIEAIMFANGHTKQLATAYFKNNTARVGIPADFA